MEKWVGRKHNIASVKTLMKINVLIVGIINKGTLYGGTHARHVN
jgi:hypothetical protein